MTTSNNHPLPQELIQAGLKQLTNARAAAMAAIASELQSLIPAVTSTLAPDKEPEGIPAWASEAFTAAGMKEGRCCWKTLHEHLSRRTAELVGATSLADEVTGKSLADFLGLDLYALAEDGWSMVKVVGPSAAEGAL